MKKIFSILFLSIFFAYNANASEIFGKISTDLNQNPPVVKNNPASPVLLKSDDELVVPDVPIATTSKKIIDKKIATSTIKIEPLVAPDEETVAKVMGTKIYPDGTLLRGADNKIYLIQGKIKKHITDLRELWKYRGRPIFSASEEELASYSDRAHINGELIRQKGDVKVYVIVNGAKKHILDLIELRAYYSGLEIFNIEPEEMALYPKYF
jgi:hypothetical protein